MAIAPKSTTKITEGQLRKIVRSEIATALPHRRSMSESPTQRAMGDQNSWTYDENGVGLDGGGSVVAAWQRFTAACVALSRFADMSFPEDDSPMTGTAGGMVSVLEMAKHQVDVILDEQ